MRLCAHETRWCSARYGNSCPIVHLYWWPYKRERSDTKMFSNKLELDSNLNRIIFNI